MKKIITLFLAAFCINAAFAQNELYNNGTTLQINTGCIIQVNGNATFESGSTLTNDGIITITGNITNNQSMIGANTGSLVFNGTTAQTLNGTSAYYAKNITVNNAAGINIGNPLKIDGTLTFTNGIVAATTTANTVIFTSNGTTTGTSDASHINGYVVKEGTATFTYPVGDGIKYQKIDVNATANATGIRVKYNATNAGAGTYTTTGTETTALASYNTNEYWDITPLSTATATVTIYWDGYKDTYTNPLSQRKVAHLSAGNWLNEGTSATGTTTSGSVTSNSITTWSPFTLGSITSILPLSWLNVNGMVNNKNQATVKWQVQENNIAYYQVEKCTNTTAFKTVGTINSIGDGTNNYIFTDTAFLNGSYFYRLKQTDKNGIYSYSPTIKLSNQNYTKGLTIYPTVFKDGFTIIVSNPQVAILTSVQGKVEKIIQLNSGTNYINTTNLSSGMYILKTEDSSTQKIIKQ